MTLPLRTVVQALEDAAASSRTGYRFMEEGNTAEPFFTFSGIERATAKFGAAMQALGLRQGDRIALILPDNQDFVFAFLGALRAGIVPVPIYPPAGLRQLTGYLDSTLHILTKSGAKMVLTDSDIKRLLGTLQRRASTLRAIVAVESIRRSREKLRPVKITPEDTCFLQFTSGSTSLPKGVVVSHRNVAANVRAFMQIGLGIHDGVDSGVSWLPLYHDMGLIGFVLAPLFHRNTVTFLPPLLFLKRPVRWLEAISRHRGSISFGPNFAYALCVKRIRDSQLSGLDLSSWRVAGCGAEPIRAANLRAFAQKFEPVGFDPCALLPCYGMAEATLAISFIRLGDGLVSDIVDADAIGTRAVAAPASDTTANPVEVVNCGKAFVDHQLAVFAADDSDSSHPLADRQVGELRLRGPSVTSGYFNEPELTKRAFAGEWMRTGDIGYQVDGDVYICGRSKDLIIINGRNYHPQDLEWAASHIEGVRKGSVLAFGTRRPLKDRERVVVAFETAIREEG
ncbi:MAG TPA: fatty acyl-AMP ligase, partial [Sorangium sp.]|nr:fatty acyl-AMP ligase [Sorangium sp.]